ncbi:ABC transporter ATP-binding protein [Paracoccaceae bacterium Fryx2]|nr:ABC transporter ATP-binding protein [Paracoccaceae bacterium Fryx2]
MPHHQTTAWPVQVQSLSKHFGAVRAVEDVSFDIRSGEFLTLLGPSGSGKTTLLMMIAGFSRPTAGSIRIADQEIVHLPPHKRNIGMVFQNYALFPHMTVGENIAYPLRLRKVGRSDIEDRIRAVLDMVQLSGYAGRRINELSGGQRQRIALARAIVFEPRVLLMDEPLSALDKHLRETMQIEIRTLHDRLGMTTISVTHDQREALTMSDRIAVFSSGRLAQIGTPSDLYEKPESRFIAEFIGESTFLPLHRVAGGLAYGDQVIRLAQDTPRAAGGMLLMLRPELLRLCTEADPQNPGANRFRGRVQSVVFQGESLLFEVLLDGGHMVFVRMANRSENLALLPQIGQQVALRLEQADARIVRAED